MKRGVHGHQPRSHNPLLAHARSGTDWLPARASEQGNVIGLVSVYIYIYISESTVVLSM